MSSEIANNDGKNASTPLIEQQTIDAETLAGILDVHVWSFKYSGGPVRCWLEIEEVGQQTMPKRLPDEDQFINGSGNKGEIRFLWLGNSPAGGGAMKLNCNPGDGYALGLGNKAFVFDWRSWRTTGSTPTGQMRSVEANEGEEVVLMYFKATEGTSANDTTKPREVTLTLKAIIGENLQGHSSE